MRVAPLAIVFVVISAIALQGCTLLQPAPHDPEHQETLQTPPAAPSPSGGKAAPYRAAKEKVWHLQHTRLYVSFNWQKQHLNGQAVLQLSPHWQAQDNLVLDAKGFDVHEVALLFGQDTVSRSYEYNGQQLAIQLNAQIQRHEDVWVYIRYTAKPNELETQGSEAITDAKGLYFIDPLGEDPSKPSQVWTQGETEASSCWFPTLDAPNQKTTQEIYITVDSAYHSLSNGELVWSKGNPNGTRTDYWQMEQPHAPYLFMMAVGEFAVVREEWNNKEVSYWVEPEWEPYAKHIFGRTPAMLEFFSERLGVEYPWPKYAQVVVRDFVSGAMENTSASVFMEQVQAHPRALYDDHWDGIIAHELMHQWFGDYVTCESWSNLTLNEAFANYSEYLWAEHAEGHDQAEFLALEEWEGYLREAQEKQEPLIRYRYAHREDMFDAHSYNKGGRVLHMLRLYVGDEAFFAALNLYLTRHAYQAVEVHHLRLAFEEITGQDLNWFFDQWFLAPGHPQLEVDHTYNDSTGVLALSVSQRQDVNRFPVYRLPLTIDFWVAGERISKMVTIEDRDTTFTFQFKRVPSAVVFDAQRQVYGEISHAKSVGEWAFQYQQQGPYGQWQQALYALADSLADSLSYGQIARNTFKDALDDPHWSLRLLAVEAWDLADEMQRYKVQVADKMREISLYDENPTVRAAALSYFWDEPEQHAGLFRQLLADSSYFVAGTALQGYMLSGAADVSEAVLAMEDYTSLYVVLPIAEFYGFAYEYVTDRRFYDWYISRLAVLGDEDREYLLPYFGQGTKKAPMPLRQEGLKVLEALMGTSHQQGCRQTAFTVLDAYFSDVPGATELISEYQEQFEGQF